jgi:hypothetical protein
MDDPDQRLIPPPRREAGTSVPDRADQAKASRRTVRPHRSPKESGEIARFTAQTRSDKSDAPVRALMMIGIERRGEDRITARLTGSPGVAAVHSTNGKWDLIAGARPGRPAEFDGVARNIA